MFFSSLRVFIVSLYQICNYRQSEWSTVVDIFIPPPSFKPVSLPLSRSPLYLKHPNKSFFNAINIFEHLLHTLCYCFIIYFFRFNVNFFMQGDLCTKFTSQLTQYIPNMAACLHDRDPVLRRHTLLLMTHLLQRDYIRLRPGVFYRLAAVLADSVQELRDHAEYVRSKISSERKHCSYRHSNFYQLITL